MNRLLLPLLFATLCLQTSPLMARSFGSSDAAINWGGLTVELIDLSGGVDVPMLKWTDQKSSISSTFYPGESVSLEASDWTTPLDINLEFTDPNLYARGTADPNILTLNSFVQTNLSDSSNTHQIFSSAFRAGVFSLSGNGTANFRLDWGLNAAGDEGTMPGCWVGEDPECQFLGAGSGGALATFSVKFNGLQNQQGNSDRQNEFWVDTGFGPCHYEYGCFDSYSGTYAFEMINSGVGDVTGEFSVGLLSYAYAHDNHPVSAVPESEVYAMLSAGLVLIGYITRRRKDI